MNHAVSGMGRHAPNTHKNRQSKFNIRVSIVTLLKNREELNEILVTFSVTQAKILVTFSVTQAKILVTSSVTQVKILVTSSVTQAKILVTSSVTHIQNLLTPLQSPRSETL